MSAAGQAGVGSLLGKIGQLRDNIESVFIGKSRTVNELIIGLLSRGHILIEDVPGVGKTVLARALARSIDCSFSRVQLTPDLLPADILGVSIYNERTGTFEFKKGPIFANIVLADEINRTTPRTQSALLEAMNEAQVSVDGQTFRLEQPFMVVATQNPFEFEGTYFLPENQLDRFTMRIRIGYPERQDERRILRQQPSLTAVEQLEPIMSAQQVIALQDYTSRVRISDELIGYGLDIVEATRKHAHLEVGVSPRGTLALVRTAQASAVLAGRDYVVPDDIKQMVLPVCAHRVISKSYVYDGHAASNEQIVGEILQQVATPA
ncbi:MAG: AAA family ATPase [Phycisphaerae bacterium]